MRKPKGRHTPKNLSPEPQKSLDPERITSPKGLAVHALFWQDAVKLDNLDMANLPTPSIGVTIGIIMHMDKEKVTIASEIFEDGHARDVTTVPRGMVRAIKKIGTVRYVRET